MKLTALGRGAAEDADRDLEGFVLARLPMTAAMGISPLAAIESPQ
jgi:hypothetical protein